MDVSQYAIGSFVIIGFVNIYGFIIERNWVAFGKATTAILAGAIFGSFKMFGLDGVETGLLVAISSSGIYKISQIVGGVK